ncbi:MAG: hypothetical protein V3W52_07565 [Syntrophobacteria bacterium]
MSNQGEVYDGVESILAKLHVLRDSCAGVMHKEESNTNLIWFQRRGDFVAGSGG